MMKSNVLYLVSYFLSIHTGALVIMVCSIITR